VRSRAAELVRQALFENVSLKVVAFLCALGFFLFLRGAERTEGIFYVAVRYTEVDASANRVLVRDPPTEIGVKLAGPSTQIDALGRNLGTTVVDLSTGHETIIEIEPAMIPNVPPGVEVKDIFPKRIEVRWDDVIEKEVPVQVALAGEPEAGFRVRGGATISPEIVSARGPKSVVNLLQVAKAAPFDVSGLSQDGYHTKTLLLDLPPQGVELGVASVTATVEIIREERLRDFKLLRVDVIGAPKATVAERVTVKVRGAPDVVAGLEAEQIAPYVELPPETDVTKPGSVRAKVQVDVPNTNVEVSPREVTVKW
jgi:YbbR domain-containing protein